MQKIIKETPKYNALRLPYQKLRKTYSQATYSRIQIKRHKAQTELGSTTDPSLFLIFH